MEVGFRNALVKRILYPFPVSIVHVDDLRKRHEPAPSFFKKVLYPTLCAFRAWRGIYEDIILQDVKSCQ